MGSASTSASSDVSSTSSVRCDGSAAFLHNAHRSGPAFRVGTDVSTGSSARCSEHAFACHAQRGPGRTTSPEVAGKPEFAYAMRGGPAVQQALEMLLEELDQRWRQRLDILREEMESKVSDAEGRAHAAEATLAEVIFDAGRRIQAANEVARNAQERASLDRECARDLVVRERVAMEVRVAELEQEAIRVQQHVESLAVQLAESKLATKRLEGRPTTGALATMAAARAVALRSLTGPKAEAQLEDITNMVESKLCFSTVESLRVPAQLEGESVEPGRRSVDAANRAEQLKGLGVDDVARHCCGSVVEDVMNPRQSKPRAVSVDSSRQRSRGRDPYVGQADHEATRHLLRTQAALANATRTAHTLKAHLSYVHQQRSPDRVVQRVAEPLVTPRERRRATSCRTATGRAHTERRNISSSENVGTEGRSASSCRLSFAA